MSLEILKDARQNDAARTELASTDYWPEKIDTHGVTAFGMKWNVFSEVEMRDLLRVAATHGLVPVGPLDFEAERPNIVWNGRSYTFALAVLRKTV